MSQDITSIGLRGFGLYLPSEISGAPEIAEVSGLSLEQLEELGIRGRHQPAPEDQPVPMAARAAEQALEDAGLAPEEIDVVVWTGEEYKDYIAQTASIRLQEELGCREAFAYDLVGQGTTLVLGLRIARDMMLGDDTINTVLLAGGTRNLDLVDPANEDTRFLLAYSASGAAAVLQRGFGANRLLAATVSTEPGLADEVYVPGGGTEMPFARDNLDSPLMYFNVAHPEVVQAYLAERFPQRLAQEALRCTGGASPDFLALRHLPPASRAQVLEQLGLDQEQSPALYEWGHHGANDVLISLQEGLNSGAVRDGSLLALVSGGIGFTYAAAALQWGPSGLGV